MEIKLFRPVPPGPRRKRRGIALIMVLACVVLLTVMVLAFLVSISGEVQSSKFYANGSSVKLLAQSATDLVMAEIRDATANGSLCWASQPGMIRTWDNTGKAKNYYKLYSDAGMVGTGAFNHTQTLVPDGVSSVNGSTVAWYNQQGVYVDLNQPVSVNGINQYPILDGDYNDYYFTAFTAGSNTTTPIPPLMTTWQTVPSASIEVLGGQTVPTGLPNGFWLNSNTPSQGKNTPQTAMHSQAPMPVRWLYVLRDGSIAVPATDTSNSTTVTFLTQDPVTTDALPTPSSTNPIVGRMAFWTDDETCKVNVNTASEGTYWDIPRANSNNSSSSTAGTGDTQLETDAPVQYEFQRYPGHPAMTSLSAVFNLPASAAFASSSTLPSPSPETSTYVITPRVGPGGSTEGTVQTTQGKVFTAITPNSNRLYATTDEFMFQANRALNSSLTGGSALDQTTLKDARFFITASSRAPDVNLFNQPRISMWPIAGGTNTGTAYRSVYDNLIAFCSTMRTDLATPYLYYFQRQDPTDNFVDLPSSGNTTGLARNRMLMSYLRYLMGQPVPGFSSSTASPPATFANKYNTSNPSSTGTDCDQILTEIFDYIRSTNLRDPSVTTPYTYSYDTSYSGGVGQVVPIEDTTTTTRGFGRYRTVQGGTILFIANADGFVPTPPATTPPSQANSQPASNPVAAGYMRIQAIFLPQFFDPSPGSVFDNPSFAYTISGLNTFTVGTTAAGTTPLGFNSPVAFTQNTYSYDNAYWGDQLGIRQVASSKLVSASVDVQETPNVDGGTFTFSGGTVTIVISTPTGSTGGKSATNQGVTLQTVVLNFPGGTFPLPQLAPSAVYNYGYGSSSPTGPYNMRYFNSPPALATPNTASGPDYSPETNSPSPGGSLGGRLATGEQTDAGIWITQYDVVRSVSTPADIRLIAVQKTVPTTGATYPYAPVGSYSSSTLGAIPSNGTSGLHTFFDGQGEPHPGAMWGKLVANGNYDFLAYAPGNCGWNTMQYSPAGTVLNAGSTVQANEPGGYEGVVSCYNFQDVFNPSTGGWLNGVTMGSTAAFTTTSPPAAIPPAQVLGDWDNGIAMLRDGPFINKADEGDTGTLSPANWPPYNWKGRTGNYNLTSGLFTPNRMIPSPVMFGSLPTGVFANKPWQTLLFRPGPIGHTGLGTSATTPNTPTTTYGTDQGPPYTTLPDHLLLDLFSMPVVEPYAISEPLSTAGRINMNYLIVPFTYINRDTGLRAVLKSEQVVSITDALDTYKIAWETVGTPIRFPVNVDATLSQFFTRRFNSGDIFRSPSEICDIDIVPNDTTATTGVSAITSATPTRKAMDSYWNGTGSGSAPANGHRLTGDNSRERIYATLYPRLTTKSNTYTIHFRVQTLKQALAPTASAAAWQSWREGTDVITGEYRGSQMIERYIDPNDTSIPDFAASPSTSQSLAPYYKFRVLSVKQFAP